MSQRDLSTNGRALTLSSRWMLMKRRVLVVGFINKSELSNRPIFRRAYRITSDRLAFERPSPFPAHPAKAQCREAVEQRTPPLSGACGLARFSGE